MQPFACSFARPQRASEDVTALYTYDPALQLNVLSDGRPAVSDRGLLLAAGTTTSTAGSQTHFDD
ncbi:putative ATP-grasp-modified RiPP [Streptomyces ficellus]|uniref:Putative ATP-grasp-modified RiPP n=1 Tax=Streptomyces ficellus TaxID=1977088 RepID=A0A6I6F9P3_9ACTN|nr:putative ATP-grasp-modified RiPP [Streptomyces ficellus]QGV77637.1 putative ATP-grasp-modified RiPP [Streptomyces ficellus]